MDSRQQTIGTWAKPKRSKYSDIVIVPQAGTDLPQLIDTLAAQHQFVIIDVQGTANNEITAAISRASLVLIPMQGKFEDARVATAAIEMIHYQENLFQRKIPHTILFTRTSSPRFRTHEERNIRAEIAKLGIPILDSDLNERTAYSQMLARSLSLEELPEKEVNGLENARQNAYSLANEIGSYFMKSEQ